MSIIETYGPKKRGVKRRARDLALSTSVRMDKLTKQIAVSEFGSVGNALYYLTRGIQELRKERNLELHQIKKTEEEGQLEFTAQERVLLIEALEVALRTTDSQSDTNRRWRYWIDLQRAIAETIEPKDIKTHGNKNHNIVV